MQTALQVARLERILGATQRLLGEMGIEKLTMRDVAKASQVAESTLYYQFGGRDGLVTAAVLNYVDRYVKSVLRQHPVRNPVQRLIYSIGVVANSSLEAQPFARALLHHYFKVTEHSTLATELNRGIYAEWLKIIEELAASGALRGWVSVPWLCGELCERIFSVTLAWGQNRFADDELVDRMTLSILVVLLGATQGPHAQMIEERLVRLSARLTSTAARKSRSRRP